MPPGHSIRRLTFRDLLVAVRMPPDPGSPRSRGFSWVIIPALVRKIQSNLGQPGISAYA